MASQDNRNLNKLKTHQKRNLQSSRSKSNQRGKSYQLNADEQMRAGSTEPNDSPKKQSSKIRRKRIKSAFVLTGQLAKTQATNSQNLDAESEAIGLIRNKQRSPESTYSKLGSTQISRGELFKSTESPYGPLIPFNRSNHQFYNKNRFDIRNKSLTTAQNIANIFSQQDYSFPRRHYLASEI